MIAALARPLPASKALVWIAGACVAIAIYCLAYTALAGHGETLGQALAWSASMIAPWLAAIELQKRMETMAGRAAVLLGALVVSLVIGIVLLGAPLDGFEIIRRLPALAAAALVAAVLEAMAARSAKANPPGLPLRPQQIDWIKAAGNYVELHGEAGTITHRSTLAATEQDLSSKGFVRIHRSILVRRDAIARVRPDDVVLVDGTHLKTGKSFRPRLAA